ncbi:type I-C CRISPR-associated protein Cas7/Csd2 [Bifidobacterium animalis subsp. animalis]|nr:type I-C CRISPR-associated protein Cas7/Csd2 [Bifidobacterium animalis subsp. animalis]
MTSNDAIQNRYDFSIFFDVENGNPNGDPDAGNMPRLDDETGLGLVTDVCIKRKIRNYVQLIKDDQTPYRIYIQNRVPLNRLDAEALKAENIPADKADVEKNIKAAKKKDGDLDRKIRDYMCENFFDIRTFGAVMTTFTKGSLSCGQVRGPVQLGFGRSLDPVMPQEITITRVAITTEEDAEKKSNEMGRKYIIPYGLYRMDGYVSACLAEKTTGFSNTDLELLWEALLHMFEFDRSAARGNMATRKLYVFKHDSALGDAPSYKLFDGVHAKLREGITVPRRFEDYDFDFSREGIPDSIQVTEMVDGVTL